MSAVRARAQSGAAAEGKEVLNEKEERKEERGQEEKGGGNIARRASIKIMHEGEQVAVIKGGADSWPTVLAKISARSYSVGTRIPLTRLVHILGNVLFGHFLHTQGVDVLLVFEGPMGST